MKDLLKGPTILESLESRLDRLEKYILAEEKSVGHPTGACCPWMQIRAENHVRPLLISGWFKMKYCPNCGRKV